MTILSSQFQFYLLKPEHVPKPEKEDISISGNRPEEEEEEEVMEVDGAISNGDVGTFTNQTRENKKKK